MARGPLSRVRGAIASDIAVSTVSRSWVLASTDLSPRVTIGGVCSQPLSPNRPGEAVGDAEHSSIRRSCGCHS